MRLLTKWTLICLLTCVPVSLHTLFSQRNPGPHIPSQDYSEQKEFTEVIKGAEKEYSIEMKGKLDFENSSTRAHNDWVVSFQPNLSLTLENIGDTLIENPKIIINDRGNWHTRQMVGRHL